MNYPKNLNIVRYPLAFQNTRKRLKRRNIAFNFPIIISTFDSMFQNISDYNDKMKTKGYSGVMSHFQIDENGVVYECRDTMYQNGFAEHPHFLADDIIKNSIIIQIKSPKGFDIGQNEEIKKSLKTLLSYLCITELLCPITDIKDMGDYFCEEMPSLNQESFKRLKKEIMNELFKSQKIDWDYADKENYSIIVVPDYEDKYRTIEYISKVLAESNDFDKWYPFAIMIEKTNTKLCSKLKDASPEKDGINKFVVPVKPGTLIIAPQSPYIDFTKSIIQKAGLDMARQKIANTAVEVTSQISADLKAAHNI